MNSKGTTEENRLIYSSWSSVSVLLGDPSRLLHSSDSLHHLLGELLLLQRLHAQSLCVKHALAHSHASAIALG